MTGTVNRYVECSTLSVILGLMVGSGGSRITLVYRCGFVGGEAVAVRGGVINSNVKTKELL